MPERMHSQRQPEELSVRGVRLFKENRPDYSSDSAAYVSIAEKLGCSHFLLREWCIQAERDADEQLDRNSADKAKIKDLKDKNEDWSLQKLVPNAHLTNSAWHEA